MQITGSISACTKYIFLTAFGSSAPCLARYERPVMPLVWVVGSLSQTEFSREILGYDSLENVPGSETKIKCLCLDASCGLIEGYLSVMNVVL